jgi:hypothetical protein
MLNAQVEQLLASPRNAFHSLAPIEGHALPASRLARGRPSTDPDHPRTGRCAEGTSRASRWLDCLSCGPRRPLERPRPGASGDTRRGSNLLGPGKVGRPRPDGPDPRHRSALP